MQIVDGLTNWAKDFIKVNVGLLRENLEPLDENCNDQGDRDCPTYGDKAIECQQI